jgi:hypothetical protein
MTDSVYVHIGLGKTGTTTIQQALDACRGSLATYGVEVAAGAHRETRRAVYDLMGRRIGGGDNAGVAGAFASWATSVRSATAPIVVCSEEMLAGARGGQVRRLVDALAPRQVVVVLTLRDLGSVLASYWQQTIATGRTESFEEFIDAVRNPSSGNPSVGVSFWLRHDLDRVLSAWGRRVPVEDFRLVVVPPTGGTTSLEDRFASVLGVPEGVLRLDRRANASLNAPAAEVLRRLNGMVALPENERLHLVRLLRTGLVDSPGPQIGLPVGEVDWVNELNAARIELIAQRGYPVVGPLHDLMSEPGPATSLTEAELAATAVLALSLVAQDDARLWSKVRRRQAPVATTGGKLASKARAVTFRVKGGALDRADHSRVLGWAARTYLRLTSGREARTPRAAPPAPPRPPR